MEERGMEQTKRTRDRDEDTETELIESGEERENRESVEKQKQGGL